MALQSIAYTDVVTYPDKDGRAQQVDQNHPLPVVLSSSGGAAAPAGTNTDPQYEKGAYATVTDATLGAGVSGLPADNLPAGTTQTLGVFDAKDFQSVAIGILLTSAYTGTLSFDESMDGVKWTRMMLVRRADGVLVTDLPLTGAGPGALGIYAGDIGGRYVRVRQAAYTAGAVTVQAIFSALSLATIPQQALAGALPSGTNTLGYVAAIPSVANEATSTTALAANATYSTTQDQGTNAQTRRGKLRVLVSHLAGLTPASLQIQESPDAATYRTTRVVPIPSDGLVHTFEFPVSSRAYKVNLVNGATAQTAFFIQSHMVGDDSNAVDSETVLAIPLSTTALGASATFIGPTLDLGSQHSWQTLRALGRGDQAFNLGVQQSKDGAAWYNTRPSDAGAGATVNGGLVSGAASANEFGEWKVLERYLRVFLVNTTATAMTVTDVNCALVSL